MGSAPDFLVFSKHGVGGKPQIETEREIMDIYPKPLYFRVAFPDNDKKSITTIAE